MGLIDELKGRIARIDAMEVADAIRARAEEAGPPPAVSRLGTAGRSAFDRVLDALNRLPRPVMTLGTLALLAAAVAAPTWFTARMEALARLPEGVWWAVGGILGLHFGARAQDKAQEARREASAPAAPERAGTPSVAAPRADAALTLGTLATGPNAAIDAWRATQA